MSLELHPVRPPMHIRRPVMLQGWKKIAYAHWPVEPEQVQSRLPDGLFVDTFDGAAWVGLVAFSMQGIRLPGTPPVPYLGSFPETNVRTYVKDGNGRHGVWFDSLDITRLVPVIVARASYRLPYMWAKMSISEHRDQLVYRAQRRWPQPRGVNSTLAITRRDPVNEPSQLERFLTARWGLFTQLGSKLAYAPVEHDPWPLERADLDHLDDGLVTAAGYRLPAVEPIVHYSAGVDVRIGLPQQVDS